MSDRFSAVVLRVVVGFAVVAVLGTGVARGQYGHGSIVGWGEQVFGMDLSADLVMIAGGGYHSLGLKADGSILPWGRNGAGQCSVPEPNMDFVAVVAGCWHTLGLKADGSIVAWGSNCSGQCNVPAPNTDFVAAAGGHGHSLGLKATA